MFKSVKVVDNDGSSFRKKNYDVNETIYFDCYQYYELEGPTQATCNLDSKWNLDEEETPTCVGMFVVLLENCEFKQTK